MKSTISTILMINFFLVDQLQAQSDHYDNLGKINAVVAVVLITLAGIVFFLFYLEKRIKILEKMIKHEQRSE